MSERFPVHNITHKPTRTQQGNIQEIERLREPDEQERQNSPIKRNATISNPTPESASVYFDEHAEGELAVLYKNTANWLKEFIQLRSMKAKFEAKVTETE